MAQSDTALADVVLDYDGATGHGGGGGSTARASREWEQIAAQWQTPVWIQDAKFGLWAHWGPQSVPRLGGGWYARHMYMPEVGHERWGENAYRHHLATYGHPFEFGYKDLIHHHFKAENFAAETLVKQFRDWGARYVAIMGMHHDNFDLFPSSFHAWNSVRIGPGRDFVGEFAAAARRHGLPLAVSWHAAASYFPPAGTADAVGPRAGVPYDLALTAADGRGQWWQGLDPRQLYGPPQHLAGRMQELITAYHPDMLYFDSTELPYGHNGEERDVLTRYFRECLARDGSIQTVFTAKKSTPGVMLDIERGQLDTRQDFVWQTCTTMFNGWFRKEDAGDQNLRYDTRCLVEMLTDIVSKNGVLLLNVALYGDGSIPADQARELQGLADWLGVNGAGIYATRPWVIHGTGGQTAAGHFSERTRYASEPWGAEVVRFTRSQDNRILYAFIYGEQAGRELTLDALGAAAGHFGGTVSAVSVLGGSGQLPFRLNRQGLHVKLPGDLPRQTATVLRIVTNGL